MCLKQGTSERGTSSIEDPEFRMPVFNHALIVFGGVSGLEYLASLDANFTGYHVRDLFDIWLNCCPRQGSRTIRTEEALLVVMAALAASGAAPTGEAPVDDLVTGAVDEGGGKNVVNVIQLLSASSDLGGADIADRAKARRNSASRSPSPARKKKGRDK